MISPFQFRGRFRGRFGARLGSAARALLSNASIIFSVDCDFCGALYNGLLDAIAHAMLFDLGGAGYLSAFGPILRAFVDDNVVISVTADVKV